MPPTQLPSVSRDVHYNDPTHGGPIAAKVTAVHEDGTVDLILFPPHHLHGRMGVTVGRVAMATPDGATPTPGCWNWPPRV
jgi:hypothetical protein